MTISDDAAGSGSTVVGRVVVIYDKVKAISADGMVRALAVDSPIFAHDTIVAEGSGRVSIVIDDNPLTQIDLDGMINVIIDEDIFGGTSPEEIAEAVADVGLLQESFLVEGVDLSVPESSAVDEVASDNDGQLPANSSAVFSRGDISSPSADKVTVIFDQSDYPDQDNGNTLDDPLDNLIDPGEINS